MPGLRKSKTLFEAVPALGAISAQGQGRAKLIPVGFDHPGFELTAGVNRLGRDPGQNHHVVLSSHVSRCHCEVIVSGASIRVRDAASHNGTYVNDEKITEHELRPGDKLGLSRRVSLMLVMDTDLEKPLGVEVQLGLPDAEVTSVSPAPPPLLEEEEDGSTVERPEPAVAAPAASSSPLAVSAERPIAGPTGQVPALPARSTAARPGQKPSSAFVAPPPVAAQVAVTGVPAARSMERSRPDGDEPEPDQAMVLKEIEQQRNVLAILYQVSLRCLMADNAREAEKLLVNVLQRLVPLEAGFILYQVGGSWRASICPSSRRPADETVRACYQLVAKSRTPQVVENPAELAGLGLSRGSALVVPLLFNEQVTGVIGAIGGQTGIYTPSLLDLLLQLANIAAAALRDR